ncbi:MAG: hypothetical protein ACRDKA_01785 [Actinomycetota bacterium]
MDATFLTVDFLAADFLVVVVFAVDFLAVDFLAADALAGDFLGSVPSDPVFFLSRAGSIRAPPAPGANKLSVRRSTGPGIGPEDRLRSPR